ncbi:ADP-ribose pyrophosphatase [Anaerolineae bacterium]|nr:ADP-ribose pyrophosphatase [Anaerolineae bacterium]
MQDATLVFLVRDQQILLGLKKRGLGEGKYNGFGGKVEPNEAIADAAARELQEECGIHVAVRDLQPVARIEFFFAAKPEWNQVVHAFIAKQWRGEPIETDEMSPRWFATNSIPYDRMWADDQHWLPRVLQGKRVAAVFTFKEDNETVESANIRQI